jgi:hypothetical protein
VGFPLWTLGILSGTLRLFASGQWHSVSKLALSFVVWGIYTLYFASRGEPLKWTPVRSASLLVLGFLISLGLFLLR